MNVDWKVESQRFDGVAEDYDAYRPSYPPELIQAILDYACLPPNGRILEVGSGTGHATQWFARRGYSILCVEPGTNLVALAAKKFQDDPQIKFATYRFEDWPGEEKAFNLVLSAQAWHWVPRDVGYTKAAAALQENGTLALFWNMYPESHGPIFSALDEIYRQKAKVLTRKRPSQAELARSRAQELDASGCFQDLEVLQFPWSASYTVTQYLGLLHTYSDHLALPEGTRQELFDGVASVISSLGGMIEKPYLAVLYLARKRK